MIKQTRKQIEEEWNKMPDENHYPDYYAEILWVKENSIKFIKSYEIFWNEDEEYKDEDIFIKFESLTEEEKIKLGLRK